MNALNIFRRAAAVALFAIPSTLTAQEAPAAPAASNYDAVAKQLQTGGVFYTLMDIDGDLAKFAGIGDGLLDLAREESGGALPPGLSTMGFLKALGLEKLKAVGMSSTRGEGTMFHNRAFLYMPEGRSGLFKLAGGPAAPLQSPGLVPAQSDLVMETELTLGAVLEIAEALIQSTGDANLMQQYKGALGFPVPLPGLQTTAGEFISRLNTRIILAGRLLENESFTPPGEKFSIPGFRGVISFDQLDFLAAPLLEYAKQSPDAVVESGDGFELIRPKKADGAVEAFPSLKPLFYHDLKTKRLLLASHPEAVTEFLNHKAPISGNPEFIKAMSGLPMEGNELSWITPALYRAFSQTMTNILKSAPQANGTGSDAAVQKKMLGLMEQFSAVPTHPMVSVRANLPEGMLFLSKNTSSFKSLLALPAAMATGAIAAVGFGAYSSIQPGIREKAKAAPKDKLNPEDEKEAPAGDADAEAIRSNLQQITFAAQTWFLDNADGNDVTYDQLIKSELLFRLEPIKGEKYEGLKIQRAGGTLTVKPAGGEEISRKYGPVTD